MDNKQKTEIINRCIDKWESIKIGNLRLKDGTTKCQLCEHFSAWSRRCPDCPLSQIGKGCYELKSVWNKFNEIGRKSSWGFYIPSIYNLDIDKEIREKLILLCDQQISNLKESREFIKFCCCPCFP